MKILTLFLALLLLTNIASAKVSSSGWDNVITKINTQGTFNPSDEEIPASYALRDIKGSKDETHLANYVNEWGYLDSETGKFNPAYVSMVSEQWTLSSDNIWVIDQWICLSTVEGELYKISHATVVETQDNQVLDYKNEDLDSNSASSITKFNELIVKWNVN